MVMRQRIIANKKIKFSYGKRDLLVNAENFYEKWLKIFSTY
jgi:hypothetical protein